MLLLLLNPSAEKFYRYLDITPTMGILPRGELSAELASVIRCHSVEERGDTLLLRGYDRGCPIDIPGLSHTVAVVREGMLVKWLLPDHRYEISLDEHHRPVFLARIDSTGAPLPGRDGSAFVEWFWESSDEVTVNSLDGAGEPLPLVVQPLYRATAAGLDDNGDLFYFQFQPVTAFGYRYLLDGAGRPLVRTAVDSTGNPVETSDGLCHVRYVYDSGGNTVSVSYHDQSGSLMPSSYTLPLEGNWEFDTDGVVVNGSRIAFISREYDENCLYVSETNTGLDGTPVADGHGRVTTRFAREEHGGIAWSAWFGGDDQPVEVDGIWSTERLFDPAGNTVESSTRNASGELAEYQGGFAFTRFSHDSMGRVLLISYYDRNGLPVINTVRGCHARDHRYDGEGNPLEIRFLDTSYRLTDAAEGYARVLYLYDEEGELKETLLFDMKGERVPLR